MAVHVVLISFSLALDYWIRAELVSLLTIFLRLSAGQVLPSGSLLIVELRLTAVNYTHSLLVLSHPLQCFLSVHRYSQCQSWHSLSVPLYIYLVEK